MTGWVASLRAAEADNWEICKRDNWFGTGASRAAGIRAGDELYIWQAGQGLFAYCIVTGDAERVVHGHSYVPWPRPEQYNYVWPIEVVAELEQPLDLPWKKFDLLAGLGRVPTPHLPPIADNKIDDVRALFRTGQDRLIAVDVADAVRRDLRSIDSEHDARVLSQKAIKIRQGQGRFRALLLAAYGGRCCVTDCDVEPVLEAAHIAPYRGEHTHRVWNGLLLRADVHTLFDLDRVTVLPDGVLRVHPDLLRSTYGALDRQHVRMPIAPGDRPAEDVLRQHNARCDWLM